MSIRVVTRATLAAGAANGWRRKYADSFTGVGDASRIDTWRALVGLGENPSPDAVDSAIGDKNWTRLVCGGCLERSDGPWVLFGEAYEHHTICADCIGLAAGALREVTE